MTRLKRLAAARRTAISDHDDEAHGPLGLYGRRVGPKLRAGQAARLEAAGAQLNLASRPEHLAEPKSLFASGCRAVWLEIGFGGGEHLIWQARHNPDVGLIGCEAFVNGVAKALAATEKEGLANIRIHHGDARDVVAALGKATLERVFLLYPDPWPKRRHWKRRFIDHHNLAALHHVLCAGGELRIASDSADYVAWIADAVAAHGGFEPSGRFKGGHGDRPADWPATRYEEKALKAGRVPTSMVFRRRVN